MGEEFESEEERSLEIVLPGVSEESASSPVAWRRQKMMKETELRK